MRKGEFRPPNNIKIPEIFSNSKLTSMITSPRSTPMQISNSIRSAGSCSQIGEILGFCDFFLVGCNVFFSGTRPGRTRGCIFTFYGSYDVSSPMADYISKYICGFMGVMGLTYLIKLVSFFEILFSMCRKIWEENKFSQMWKKSIIIPLKKGHTELRQLQRCQLAFSL